MPENKQKTVFRPAQRADASLIVKLIRELAEYEKRPLDVSTSQEKVVQTLFTDEGRRPKAWIAEWHTPDSGIKTVGYAITFYHYSTFSGSYSMYLEDVFIRPEFRKNQLGRSLLSFLSRQALKENCQSMVWSVLDWNKPAIDFYARLGAEKEKGRIHYQFGAQKLSHLAQLDPAK